jgi:5-formyltetrahydrofolate cyclo-ligase
VSADIKTKAEIRKEMRRRRGELESDWVAKHSLMVAERLMELDEFRLAETVCLYMALPGEAGLSPVLRAAWDAGKRVLLPAYRKESDDYGFKVAAVDAVMAAGLWDVPEPVGEEWAQVEDQAFIAVPGVAFDDAGGRVGHGKGYYDRLLHFTNERSGCTKAGICFDFQRIESVPCEAWDIGMDMVLSESRITRG